MGYPRLTPHPSLLTPHHHSDPAGALLRRSTRHPPLRLADRKPVAVFKGDRWFDPAQLYEAIGIKPFTR